MANDNRTAGEADDKLPALRNAPADGAFEAAAPKIDVEDLSDYGSRFAHDEHHSAAHSDVEPDGEAAIRENNRSEPWDLARVGRMALYAVAGAGVHRVVKRLTRKQRRTSVVGVLGAAAAVIGVATWLKRRNA